MANKRAVLINWDKIRLEYVSSSEYPSFDTLAKKYKVSKPLLINAANDRERDFNLGMTWAEARKNLTERKHEISDNAAIERHEKIVDNISTDLENLLGKLVNLTSDHLDDIIKERLKAQKEGKFFNLGRHIRISDVIKTMETLVKITAPDSKQVTPINITFDGGKGNKPASLEELSDEELEQLEYQVESEGEIIDA